MQAKKVVQIIEEIDKYYDEIKIMFSADEKNFVTRYSNQTIKFWDKQSFKLIYLFKSNKKIEQLSLSSQGILAQTNQDLILQLNLKVVKQEKIEMNGHSQQIEELVISPDGLQLIVRSDDLLSQCKLLEMKRLNFEFQKQFTPYQFCFSIDSQYLAAKEYQTFYIWKFNSIYMIERNYKLQFDTLDRLEFSKLKNSLIFTNNNLKQNGTQKKFRNQTSNLQNKLIQILV